MTTTLFIVEMSNLRCGRLSIGEREKFIGDLVRVIPNGFELDGLNLDKFKPGDRVELTNKQLGEFLSATGKGAETK